MKLLIGASPSKIFHLNEFAGELEKQNIECKVVIDTDVHAGFPSRNISNWFDSGKKLKKLLDDFQPDAVFVDRQTNFGLKIAEQKIPLLVHLRGDFWSEIEMAKNTLYKYPPKRTVISVKEKIASKCFEKSTLILPISKYLEEIVNEKFPKNQTNVLYQGINPNNWYQDDGMKLKHPCVGLLQSANIWGKAEQMLILKKLMEKMPDVTFYWVGDGPYREKILPELSKYNNFKWLGPLKYPNEVRKYLSEIDVYSLLTGIDMSPLTLQEAQLMEKPVIATNVGGVPELMQNEKTGFLVEPNETSKLEECLTVLIEDEKKRKIMGKNGRKFIKEKFSWEVITKQFADIMKNDI